MKYSTCRAAYEPDGVMMGHMKKAYSKAATDLLKELEFLFENYSGELRATTQPYYLHKIQRELSDYVYHPDSVLVRETLMEHVGSLPMVAVALTRTLTTLTLIWG
jgi:hypothetical protein